MLAGEVEHAGGGTRLRHDGQPRAGGRRGHPAILSRRLFPSLLDPDFQFSRSAADYRRPHPWIERVGRNVVMNWNRKGGVWPIWYQYYEGAYDKNRPLSTFARNLIEKLAFSFYYII